MKIGGGWLTQSVTADITGGSFYVPLPANIVIVNFVKMLSAASSTDYVPIDFNENADGVTSTASVGNQGSMTTWCFKNGQIYLNNLPASSIANGLLIDGVFAPAAFTADGDTFSGDFDSRVFTNYVKWRAATLLRSLTTKEPAPWAVTEAEWKQAVVEYVARRYREPGFSKSFM